MLLSALVYSGTPSRYVGKEYYHTHAISFFSIIEKYYHIDSELTPSILSSPFCSVKECSIC